MVAPKQAATTPDEELVKKYQLKAVQKDVATHDKFINAFDGKLDTIIQLMQTRPTTEQVDAKIELAIKNATDKLDLRYNPIVTNNKRLLWAVVTTSLGLFASLVILVVGVITR